MVNANMAFALNMWVFEQLDVKGCVAGATVQIIRETLLYYNVKVNVPTLHFPQELSRTAALREDMEHGVSHPFPGGAALPGPDGGGGYP